MGTFKVSFRTGTNRIIKHSYQLSRILRETHAFWGGIASGKCYFLRRDPYKIKKYDWNLKISRILTFKSWQQMFFRLFGGSAELTFKVAESPAFFGRLTHFSFTSRSPPHWQLSHTRQSSHAFFPHSKFRIEQNWLKTFKYRHLKHFSNSEMQNFPRQSNQGEESHKYTTFWKNMVIFNGETYRLHLKWKSFSRKKYFVNAIWSKVENLISKFFVAAPTKVGVSRDGIKSSLVYGPS